MPLFEFETFCKLCTGTHRFLSRSPRRVVQTGSRAVSKEHVMTWQSKDVTDSLHKDSINGSDVVLSCGLWPGR